MDRNKFSHIGHSHHKFYNPISNEKMDTILNSVNLKPSDKVIDIGSGKCELLIRLIEKYKIIGTGVELYEGFIKEAQQNAAGRININDLMLINKDAKEVIPNNEDSQYAMGICVGSTHALGGLEATLKGLRKCVKNGGYIIIGEGYWKTKPSSEYLKALDSDESELNSHYGNIKLAEELGLISLWSVTASDDDWDAYECLYSMSIENYCFDNPEDPDCIEMLERIRNWRNTYFSMGRDTLGFGLYLFRNIK